MSDLIKRQDAIDAIRASTSKYTGFMEMEMYTDDDAVEAIEGVPSAQSERKTGRWTKAYDGYDGHVSCTSCFKIYDWYSQAQYYNFCPKCGAYNRERSERGGE